MCVQHNRTHILIIWRRPNVTLWINLSYHHALTLLNVVFVSLSLSAFRYHAGKLLQGGDEVGEEQSVISIEEFCNVLI
jgi:hypothetical protein